MSIRLRLVVAAFVFGFLAVHLGALPRTLEDIDSLNFAMGVESFDVANHRPHPPGYPVFIALAKASTRAVAVLRPGWDRDRRAAAGLAIWNVIAGAAGAFVVAQFWLAAGLTAPLAVLAAVLTVCSPLFWFTASRPLTDTVGLVAALTVQTGFLLGLQQVSSGTPALPRAWIWSAAGAGFIIGVRSQTIWLTGPFFCWALVVLWNRRQMRGSVVLLGVAALGALAWAVPLIVSSGGLGTYWKAIQNQGVEDLTGIELLSTRPGVRLFVLALRRTFVDPWQDVLLGHIVLGLALIAAVRLAIMRQRILAVVLVGFGPYLIFHLAFQETVTIRYSLPVVVPVAGLALMALAALGTRLAVVGVVAVASVSFFLAQPELRVYADSGAPVLRGFQDMQRELASRPVKPVVRMDHHAWSGARRVTDWYRAYWDTGPQPFPGTREWLGIVQDRRSGGTGPVWLLADPKRLDISLFDRRTRTLGGHYERPPGGRLLIGGTRLDALDWWKLNRPGWMLGTGWALTPEIAGVTEKDNMRPAQRPAEAFILRDSGPLRIMIGGRYLRGEGPAQLTVAIDGQQAAQWIVTGDPVWFVHWIDVSAGVPAGSGPYATVTVKVVAAEASRPTPDVALEQFDAAPTGQTMYALDSGWHELEHNPATGLVWRWTSERSVIDVRPSGRDLTLVLGGISPLRDFDRAPVVAVRAGARELGRFSPAADFSETIRLPLDAVVAASGRISIESDLFFVPGERGNSPDRRHLGLRLSRVEVRD